MATLTGSTIASTYTGLLSVSGAVGADTVEAVTDGAGTSTSLSLSQQRATITLGSGAADDFIVDGTTLVVEGDNNRVGIGTAAPGYLLHVEGNITGTVARFINTGLDSDKEGICVQSGRADGAGTNYLVDFRDGDGDSQGVISFSGATVTYGAFTANHDAELPEADNDDGYPYGTLVEHTEIFYKQKNGADTERGILYKVQKSSSAYAKNVLGSYAGKHSHDDNLHQIYVLGDGHILCNGEKGNIAVGDGICTSSTDGQGMKADKMAMCIGIAQEAITFSGSESKLVAVQYGLQQFTPWE